MPRGYPLSLDGLSRAAARLLAEVGFPGARLHDLRQGWCTAAMSAGVSLAVVSRAAGHAQASFTASQ